MIDIRYFEPKTIKEVISLLCTHNEGAKVLAGGTALLVLLKQKIFIPQCLINVKKIEGLHQVTSDGKKGITIGALNCLASMEFNPIIEKNWPSLVDGIKSVGSPLIRNLATVGGNICHGDPASGVISQLIALESKLRLVSSGGERWVSMDDFYVDLFETKIRPDEILTEVYIPFLSPNSGSAYLAHSIRRALDRPIVSVTAVVNLDAKEFICRQIRVVIGGVGRTAIRAKAAEGVASNKRVDLNVIEEVGDVAFEEVSPIGDIYNSGAYKREMVRVFVKRAVSAAFERAKAGN